MTIQGCCLLWIDFVVCGTVAASVILMAASSLIYGACRAMHNKMQTQSDPVDGRGATVCRADKHSETV